MVPVYNANMPCNQMGAVEKKGTDFGTHMVRSALDVAAALKLNIFILYVDLVKAFDRILRELLFGWPCNMEGSPMHHLMSLGLSREDAQWLVEYIDQNRPLLYQWGVDHKVISLLAGLHSGAWFVYGDLDTVVLCKKGGRQGCQSGPLIFNAVYSIAVKMLLQKLKSAGIVARFKHPNGLFWMGAGDECEDEDVIDVIFVDDACFILMAKSSKILDKAIAVLLKALVDVF
eukprot:10164253-Karenia_brevis.AAC.1